MRKTISIILLCAALSAFWGCENWRETAGDIAGMWQMTEWRDAANQVQPINEGELYYCFQLRLMKFQTRGKNEYYLSYFTHKGDSLLVGKTIFWPAEEERQLEELARFGVPADGKFHVDVLDDDHLVLSSREGTLSFRRY
ncbi:MAG: lipocalin-like domain-containing protein [Bacteroidaceae bacterium]|nr:lipocalin-like domain-containing protein [Bacteroidaceae bacterium]